MNKINKIDYRKIIYSLFLGIAVCLFSNSSMEYFQLNKIFTLPASATSMPSNVPYVLAIGLVLVIKPVLEELFFRKLIYNLLKLKLNVPIFISIVLTSLLFGIYHGNILQGGYAFLAGLICNLIYEWCGLIIYPIVIHIAANCSALFFYPEIVKMTKQNQLLIIIITSIICVLILYMFYRDRDVVQNDKANTASLEEK